MRARQPQLLLPPVSQEVKASATFPHKPHRKTEQSLCPKCLFLFRAGVKKTSVFYRFDVIKPGEDDVIR